MTCNTCGYELSSGDRFCSRCGRKVASGSSQTLDPAVLVHTAAAWLKPIQDRVAFWGHELKPKLQPLWSLLKRCPVPVNLLAAALQLFAVFLWFGKVLTVSVLGYTQGFSMHDMCVGAEFVSYFSAVLLTTGAVFSAFPGLIPNNDIFKKLNVPMMATVWTFVWYLVGVLGASDQVESFSRYGAEVALTAGGWLLGIVCIVAFALLVLEGRQRKPNSNTTF